jgi:hypothetical protein
MTNIKVVFSIIFLLSLAVLAVAKNRVSPEMMAIRKVYITGHNTGQVEWADKNFAHNKGSCVKPVASPEEADAILLIEPSFQDGERPANYQVPIWVSCTSSKTGTHCVDSSGYSMDTYCSSDRAGNINCTSTYGPDVAATIIQTFQQAARRSVMDVYLYNKDGKQLIWKRIRTGTAFGMHLWADELNKAIGCVQQKCPITHFKPCDTRWYDPSQIGPDGKLKR